MNILVWLVIGGLIGWVASVFMGTDEYLPVMGLGALAPLVSLPPEGKELPISLINTMMEQGGRLLDTSPFFRPNPPWSANSWLKCVCNPICS